MGFVNVNPRSKYHQVMAPVLKAKKKLGVDNWLSPGLPGTVVSETMGKLSATILQAIGDPEIDPAMNFRYLAQTALGGYTASLMQPVFAKQLKGLSETELDEVLQSFALKHCTHSQDVLTVLRKFWA
jgi:hypothetical protein